MASARRSASSRRRACSNSSDWLLAMCPHADPLAGAYIKIERAKEHVQDLETEITAFLGREPYRIVRQDDANTGEQTYRVLVSEDGPLRWGAIIGDVIHNLRTALDHLACQLVLANGGVNIDKT